MIPSALFKVFSDKAIRTAASAIPYRVVNTKQSCRACHFGKGPFGMERAHLLSSVSLVAVLLSLNSPAPAEAACINVGGTVTVVGSTGCVNWSGGDMTLINSGTLSSSSASAVTASGLAETLTNSGLLAGTGFAGLENTSDRLVMINNTTIVGSNGIANSGTINSLTNNSGATINGVNFGIYNSGTISALTNSGTISGGTAAIFIADTGTLDTISNLGVIAGNIENQSANDLAITGGATTIVGTITGSSGGIGSADKGLLTSSTADFVLDSGNILLNSDVSVTGHALVNNTNLTLANALTVTGSVRQASGSISGGSFNASTSFLMESGEVSSVLAGSAELIKSTNGIVSLTGTNTYTGATTIDAGTLFVNGSIANSSNVAISSGATLGGIGTVGNVTVENGGVISPGLADAVGTLTVSGDLTFLAGSIYALDLTTSSSDLLDVSGTADVSAGKVSVTALDPEANYQQGQTYTILTAGAVTGDFDETVTNSAFLKYYTEADGNTIKLTIGTKPSAFIKAADTTTRYAVASALDSLEQTGASLALYNSLLVMTDDEAREAFDQLTGDTYAGQQTAMVQSSGAVNTTINRRIRTAFDAVGSGSGPVTGFIQPLGYAEEKHNDPNGPFASFEEKETPDVADPNRFALWGSGFGSWGASDGLNGASDTDTSTRGFLIGADGMITDTWRAGLFGGYSASSFDTDDSAGQSDNYHIGSYAGTKFGAVSFSSGLSYTWYDVNTIRAVRALGQTLYGSYDASSLNAFGEVSYRMDIGGSALEPFAGLAYTHLKTDGFSETGGTATLTVDSSSMDTVYTTLGMRASRNFDLGGIKTLVRGSIGWQHAFGDVDPISTARFETGNSFSVTNTPIDKDTAQFEAGFDFRLDKGATLGIGYSGQFGKNAYDNGFNAKLRLQF
ncbi:autotransporter outer membrane beta-barrel domain-containing protein [Cohaesibacter haloalkalitolerans]|uniref:autotransporter outer membrane beta-barrel domain-containing protein n=1 Tax=Cohaesibacter haloalkalitolerans TaxID=1162980 RepID=UPI0013C51BE3|nr:autotransporter domain-containing protein [Cohaesibacter haloalkalitolerans]